MVQAGLSWAGDPDLYPLGPSSFAYLDAAIRLYTAYWVAVQWRWLPGEQPYSLLRRIRLKRF